jgi:hypothetical protein
MTKTKKETFRRVLLKEQHRIDKEEDILPSVPKCPVTHKTVI